LEEEEKEGERGEFVNFEGVLINFGTFGRNLEK
jgi:hypothetical protein